MGDRVTMTVADGVADVRLARPEKMNALDPAMFAAIAATIDRLADMREVRAIVLSGEGKAFCAGLDLATMAGGAPADLAARAHGDANLFQYVAWGWRTLPQPVIAAIGGPAFGGGLQIALGADIRIAAPDAELAMMEARWGLVADMAGIALLRGLVRDDIARELAYTARKIGAEEAERLGLVTRVADDPLAAALALARTIAGHGPQAVRSAKRLLNLAADADAVTILAAESAEQAALLASADHREAVTAGLQKRAPSFAD